MKIRLFILKIFFVSFFLNSCGEEDIKTRNEKTTDNVAVLGDTLQNPDFRFFCDNFFIAAVNTHDEYNLERLIHPDLGFYVAYKPTAHAVLNRFDTFSDFLEANPDFLLQMNDFPKAEKGNMPQFVNCDFFSREGAFFEETDRKNILEATFQSLEEKSAQQTKEEREKLKLLDRQISVRLLVTSSFAEFYFAFEGGRWYLCFIDFTKYDCSL
jgi:hypothetical protein